MINYRVLFESGWGSCLRGFLGGRDAAAIIGYGIVLALIAMVSLASTRDLGLEVERVFGLSGDSFPGAAPGDGGDGASNNPPVWVTEAGDLGAFVSEKTIAFQLEATDAEDGAPTFALAAGALPSGVSLSATGLISGSTTDQGTHDFTVEIADSEGAAVEQDFRMEVIPPYIEFTEPGQHTFTVPQGITSFEVYMWGGGGGGAREKTGGGASAAIATVNATPNETMTVWVGGGGGGWTQSSEVQPEDLLGGVGFKPGGNGGISSTNGFAGAGGGGASALLGPGGEAIVVVGGGGGGGGFGGFGGVGLGPVGQDGQMKSGGGGGGKGATDSQDGLGGNNNGGAATPAGGGNGGVGGAYGGGGGGGGGWYSGGGGGGHSTKGGGGGGSGSSYINGSFATGSLFAAENQNPIGSEEIRLPGNADHPYYPEGAGAGVYGSDGGDGYVRIDFN